MKNIAIPVVVAAVTCIVMAFQMITPETVVCEAPDVKLGEIDGFTSEKLEPGEAELSVLPADTRFDKRLYTAPDGHWYQVTVVIGGTSKSSIPQCLIVQSGINFFQDLMHSIAAGGIGSLLSQQ